MANVVIENTQKRVIVFKCVGMPTLRLFPGHNYVDEEGIDKYFDGRAAKALRSTCINMVSRDLTPEEKSAAKHAKKKNDDLNRAQRVIKTQNETLAQNDQTINDQVKTIERQAKAIEDLKSRLDAMEKISARNDSGFGKRGK